MIPDVNKEARLVIHLRGHGARIELGTVESRRERIRAAIQKVGAGIIFGKHPETGKTESYAAAYERIYGTPFEIVEDFV